MSEIDHFSVYLLEQAKRFLEKAQDTSDEDGRTAFVNASLLIGVSALEAHVNAIADELLETWKELEVLERSILSEREFSLDNGEFELVQKLKMYRLIDRVEFIFRRFGKRRPLDKHEKWWSQLSDALKLRNELVHPKQRITLSVKNVENSLRGILEAINALYLSLYDSPYPGYRRALDSNLSF